MEKPSSNLKFEKVYLILKSLEACLTCKVFPTMQKMKQPAGEQLKEMQKKQKEEGC